MHKLTNKTPELDQIMEVLKDTHFRCQAFRWEEELSGESTRLIVQSDNPDWDYVIEGYPHGPYQGHYDENNQCLEMVEVEMQYDYGEAGSILASYPVILSNCARYHNYAEDMAYDNLHVNEILNRYSERQQLLKKVERIVRGY